MPVQPHLKVETVPPNVVITGDPKRVALFEETLREPRKLASNREFEIVAGTYWGADICVCSTGIGAPSTALAVEELANAGAKRIIRLGTCGAMKRGIAMGDIIIPSGAIRDEGTSDRYVDQGFPAVPGHELMRALWNNRPAHVPCHGGIVWTTDKFYLSEEELAKWYDTSVAVEMECSSLFVVARLRGLESGALLVVDGNLPEGRLKERLDRPEEFDVALRKAVVMSLEALARG